ncbi:MAG: two pore domain potassium channel family protein [Alphaproteobacteria bacterium]|nr:two pore domain potassium channel family protein [Alphaproteobacteria bacterium]NDC56077.1 two pore domain potassium channel family protein [Alphaproteobacteria bacterium]NDG05468.1 two pore domain potassium channel family protein [Alphaproteobacteria bacterium]
MPYVFVHQCAGLVLAAMLVVAVVLIHYEALRLISDKLLPWAQRHWHDRRTLVLMILALLLSHVLQIWVFGVGTMLIAEDGTLGTLMGPHDHQLWDYIYFSAVNYTSLGYGDLTAIGPLRLIGVSETLTGMLMIAWSASFTYITMEHLWKSRRG